MGLTQAALGARIGISQTAVSKLERGRASSFSMETWAATAAALGFELVSYFDGAPSGDAPVDLEHLRRQALVVAAAARGGWRAHPEHDIRTPQGRQLTIDVLLSRPSHRELCVVEVWNWLADVGHAWRNHAAKIEAVQGSSPSHQVSGLFVLRGTRRNRALVGELTTLFRTRFDASSVRMLASLQDPGVRAVRGSAMAWTDASATRLLPARLGRSSPAASGRRGRAP